MYWFRFRKSIASHELTVLRLIARLPSFAVAAIDLARVMQIVWLLFNQTTVTRILAVFDFHDQIIHSSIKVVKIVERTRILAFFHKLGKLIIFSKDSVSDSLKNLVRFWLVIKLVINIWIRLPPNDFIDSSAAWFHFVSWKHETYYSTNQNPGKGMIVSKNQLYIECRKKSKLQKSLRQVLSESQDTCNMHITFFLLKFIQIRS